MSDKLEKPKTILGCDDFGISAVMVELEDRELCKYVMDWVNLQYESEGLPTFDCDLFYYGSDDYGNEEYRDEVYDEAFGAYMNALCEWINKNIHTAI